MLGAACLLLDAQYFFQLGRSLNSISHGPIGRTQCLVRFDHLGPQVKGRGELLNGSGVILSNVRDPAGQRTYVRIARVQLKGCFDSLLGIFNIVGVSVSCGKSQIVVGLGIALSKGNGCLKKRLCLCGLQTRLEHDPVYEVGLAPFRPTRLNLGQYFLSVFRLLEQFVGNGFSEEEVRSVRNNAVGLPDQGDGLAVLLVFDQEKCGLEV